MAYTTNTSQTLKAIKTYQKLMKFTWFSQLFHTLTLKMTKKCIFSHFLLLFYHITSKYKKIQSWSLGIMYKMNYRMHRNVKRDDALPAYSIERLYCSIYWEFVFWVGGGYPTLSPNISVTTWCMYMKFEGSFTHVFSRVWCKNEVYRAKTSVSSGLSDLIMSASANHSLFTSSYGAKGRFALIGYRSILQVTK